MSLPRRPAAVIFDMDGLLFNTETLSFESAVTAAAHFGHTLEWDLFHTLIGRQWPDIRLRLLAALGDTFDAEAFRALPRLRGLESNTRFAEAFVARKLVIG